MRKALLLLYLLTSFLLALNACKKEEIDKETINFLTCKIDGESFAADSLIEAPIAIQRKEEKTLVIKGATSTRSIAIYLYGQTDYSGTFRIGDRAPGAASKHYARISYGPNGKAEDYNKDSWFANGGVYTDGTTSDGTITITKFDTVNHRIEGTFEGNFYNNYESTLKIVSEGKFSLPLEIHQ